VLRLRFFTLPLIELYPCILPNSHFLSSIKYIVLQIFFRKMSSFIVTTLFYYQTSYSTCYTSFVHCCWCCLPLRSPLKSYYVGLEYIFSCMITFKWVNKNSPLVFNIIERNIQAQGQTIVYPNSLYIYCIP
jgi:hypothetical protein